MKIVLTGGGTGGHFYPLIAVAEELNKIIDEEKLINTKLIYMSDDPYDKRLLDEKDIKFRKISAGKIRRYFSLLNIIDFFKIIFGTLKAMWNIYTDFPDVVFGKGGYASFPVLFSARFFRIPVVIHESDAVPGRVNKWASKFARRVAISFSESINYFPEKTRKKIAVVGNPVRENLVRLPKEGFSEFLELDKSVPVVFILGGSQGAQKINDIVVDMASELAAKYQVIHQCGKNNFKEVEGRAAVALEKSPFKNRYRVFGFLNESAMKMAAAASDIIISRAGSSAIFEIAAWGKPSILIPLSGSAQDHQRENAYAFARTGASEVIEEKNLSPHILLSEIGRILSQKDQLEDIKHKANQFYKPEAGRQIAREIINLALEHA
ncbi:MAG: undecaprenyldiphospho-muramoylpentapeptide beta-N-acetylglucosaminyltransferase [Parcubacteria group bacterium]|nr:undecaprenyldiphospho-muramoylpentapeptide beta-N-acetylglucosaminyltransferase [Parcubacteria group bacterium]MCR4342329.1 undecaprenyldiphospho-muramoylpentapeptide beta-N-acetylglucosaminyltransferase [Patescibacteria group bacterium]